MFKSLIAPFSVMISSVIFSPAYAKTQASSLNSSPFQVNGSVALSSFMSLSDAHLQSVMNSLAALSISTEAQSGDWNQIKPPLTGLTTLNVDALIWFALPDGSYWSVQDGREKGNLSDRDYFKKVLTGKAAIGDLIVSKATGKSIAIVAVPIQRPDKSVIGVLGASIYLDKLSSRIEKEMSLGDKLIFYSFNSKPLIGLVWDPAIIFADPKKLGPEVSRAFDQMLKNDHGTVSYTFRGKKRTVIYQKSEVTGWWYALGATPEGREKKR